MPTLAYTMPFMIIRESDFKMAEDCLCSLSECNTEALLVVYNQGYLTNEELKAFLEKFNLDFVILGNGTNIGIPAGRQCCFEYIWNNMPEVEYIAEIHLDMIFTKDWANIIIDYLKTSDEPMLSPGIITAKGEILPEWNIDKRIENLSSYSEITEFLLQHREDKIMEGFVHPVIHKASILKEIGGYDTRFLKGKQGYEDDSLLIGYRYYMGTRNNWRPKCYLKSRVLHIAFAQRLQLDNFQNEIDLNLQGVLNQYGIYGLLQLSKVHNSQQFTNIANTILDRYYGRV